MSHVLAIGWPGPFEMILIAGLGLLLFGKRLPEVGRSVGRTIVEFKKGMREVERELDEPSDAPKPLQPLHPPRPADNTQAFLPNNPPPQSGPTNHPA